MNLSFQNRSDHLDIFIIVELTEKNLKKSIYENSPFWFSLNFQTAVTPSKIDVS